MKHSRLGDFIDLAYGKGLPARNRRAGSVAVFGSAGYVDTHNEALVEGPGVIVGRKGTVGAVHWSDDDFYPIDTTYYVVLKVGELRLRYVYYLLITLPLRHMNTDVAVPGLNRTNVLRLPVNIDSPSTQDRIIEVLSAYDELIENNRRRIQLLEQAARLLYKEWFVRLRFPGHEHVKVVDGIPEGWVKKTAIEVMDVLSGGTPRTNNVAYWDGDIPFYTPKDSISYAYVFETEKSITEEGLKNCNSKLYGKDTIFITARGTVGKINLAQRPMAMNQSCYALIAKTPLNQHFMYFSLDEAIEQFRSRAVGAVFDAITVDTFKIIPFVIPSKNIIDLFTESVFPILSQIDILSHQKRNLTKARDLLLPRLMNGEIAI